MSFLMLLQIPLKFWQLCKISLAIISGTPQFFIRRVNNTWGRWNCLWWLTLRLTGRQAWCGLGLFIFTGIELFGTPVNKLSLLRKPLYWRTNKNMKKESRPGQTPVTGLPGPNDARQQDADGGQVWPRVLAIALPGQRLVSLYSRGFWKLPEYLFSLNFTQLSKIAYLSI